MPKIAEIEYTPNPNAVKFLLKEPIAVGLPRSFPDVKIAMTDDLASALFATGHVESVFMQDKILTVTKDDKITSLLSPEKLEKTFDYTRQLANVDAIFKRVLGE